MYLKNNISDFHKTESQKRNMNENLKCIEEWNSEIPNTIVFDDGFEIHYNNNNQENNLKLHCLLKN